MPLPGRPSTGRAKPLSYLYRTVYNCPYDQLRPSRPGVTPPCLRHRTKNCDVCECVKLSIPSRDALKVLGDRYKVAHGLTRPIDYLRRSVGRSTLS